jgi:DNA repair exonuclease SbcCD ATPase subunit
LFPRTIRKYQRLQAEVERLQSENIEISGTNQQLCMELDSCKQDLDQYKTDLKNCKLHNDSLEDKVQLHESTIHHLKEEIIQKDSQLSRLQNYIKQQDVKISHYVGVIQEREKDIRRLKADVNTWKQKAEMLLKVKYFQCMMFVFVHSFVPNTMCCSLKEVREVKRMLHEFRQKYRELYGKYQSLCDENVKLKRTLEIREKVCSWIELSCLVID